ncbi:hypothetical protein [Akkermansia muciniphila]|uniref:hypothetical protein n=1 Tax=Akkermansia muciniphila TaxID=239935 RepID=UPI0011AF049A|nr:hypothetical protein [Akkermansia muciniphila]
MKKLLKGRMELYLDIESGIFRNRAGDENMNLCGVRLVRRQDVPVSLSFLGRELDAGRVTLAAYHKRNGQLLAYQEGQITGGAVEMVVDFDTQEIRAAAREAEGKTIEARVAVLVETEEGKGVYHSLPLNFYLEPGLIGDEHLPNSAWPEWEMMYETVVKKAEETEGYAGSALASKRAAADSAAAAGTSATNAARDAKSANDAKTDVESLAATWPETVSNGEKKIVEAGSKAVNAIQDKQANSVLAVGRAQKTATDKISGAQADAVSAVQAAGKEAQGTITPLVQRVETAKEAIDQAEGRINTAATNAANSATSAGNSATAAANALAAIPQVDAEGNMTLAGNITVMSASINGPFVAGRSDGTVSAGTCNQIYGITRFWQSLDVRSGGWWRGTMMYETGMLNIAQGASLNCIGPATFASTLNANGGVNIPLAVGAPTATGVVNRLYAAGMAGVTDIFSLHFYLNTGSITATGTAQTFVLVAGLYARVNVPANTHSTIVCAFTGPAGQWNYSSFAGFAIHWQLTSAGKLTVGIGRGSRTVRKDLTLDSYSIIPGNELAYNTGEILDITFDNARDTARGGYVVRVREIYAAETARKWMVKTTTSFIPATQNEPIPYIVNKVIYHQYAPRSYNAGDYGDAYGSLYLLTGGGSSQQLWKIAAVRGVTTFETGTGFSSIVTDIPGISGGSGSVFVGAAERTNYQPGNVNPVYYALEALAVNAVETEETADFEDINVPIE